MLKILMVVIAGAASTAAAAPILPHLLGSVLEPASLVLFGTGLIVAAFVARRLLKKG
jgi:hypothetical protein